MDEQVMAHWIKVIDGQFVCQGCSNFTKPMVEGTEMSVEDIKAQLANNPEMKAHCASCSKEYNVKKSGEDIYMEPLTA